MATVLLCDMPNRDRLEPLAKLLSWRATAARPRRAQEHAIVPESTAFNTRRLANAKGELSDRPRGQRAGKGAVGLLTGEAGNLTQWRFPATNFSARAFRPRRWALPDPS
jgi:hypothetical protein